MGEVWCAAFSVHMQGVDGTDWIPAAFLGMRKGNKESLQQSKSRHIRNRHAFGGVLLLIRTFDTSTVYHEGVTSH
jgi:hypothetical protein